MSDTGMRDHEYGRLEAASRLAIAVEMHEIGRNALRNARASRRARGRCRRLRIAIHSSARVGHLDAQAFRAPAAAALLVAWGGAHRDQGHLVAAPHSARASVVE